MFMQATSQKKSPANSILKRAGNLWFRALLVAITVTAVGMVALPVLEPILNGTSSEFTPASLSHVTRASAFVAYILLWISMLAGLSITSKLSRKVSGMSA